MKYFHGAKFILMALRNFVAAALLFFSCSVVAQNTILWSVDHIDTKHRSYLLGTFHQMGSSWVDSLTVVMEKLAEADLAIFESVETGIELQSVMGSREWSSNVREELRRRDIEWLEEYTRDWVVPLEKLHPMELHWKLSQDMARVICNTSTPEDRFDHFDNYLIHISDSLGIPYTGLETDSMQSDFINKQTGENTWKALRKTIHSDIRTLRRGKAKRGQCNFANRYMRLELGNYPLDKECPEEDDAAVSERNREWMKVLPDYFMEQSCFVAVGLLHLFYDCGLINALREAGFVVAPVYDLKNPGRAEQ